MIMSEPVEPKSFVREPQRFETTWRGIKIEVRYRPPFAQWFTAEQPIAYLEVVSIDPARAPLPITKTGYRSHVIQGADVEAAGGPVPYVLAWLEHRAAKSKKWRRQ